MCDLLLPPNIKGSNKHFSSSSIQNLATHTAQKMKQFPQFPEEILNRKTYLSNIFSGFLMWF